MVGCEGLGVTLLRGEATPRNPVLAAAALEKACTGGVATSCSNLGLMYYSADGVPRDRGRGLAYLKKACDLGFANACRWLEETKS
jgi:TPR repeat protein